MYVMSAKKQGHTGLHDVGSFLIDLNHKYSLYT